MLKKIVITISTFFIVGMLVFGAAVLINPQEVALPQEITQDSLCPVAGCAQIDTCHAAASPPEIDGTFIMECPKIKGCSETECHAYERLTLHYNKPSDSSMNLWILSPVVLVVGLILIVKKIR